jgi:uncharacterized protein (UPF0147 family)
MIDEEKLKRIRTTGVTPPETPRSRGFDLDDMTTEDLIRLHASIEAKLPPAELGSMNLERELVMQYRRILALQEDVLTDDEVPANQRAQVSNAVAATLQQLVKMQSEFHTAERFKMIESRLIKALENVPAHYLEDFFAWYEESSGE